MRNFIVFITILLCLSLATGIVLSWHYQKNIAAWVLGIKGSSEKWAQTQEVRSLVLVAEALEKDRRRMERAARKKAEKAGLPYVPKPFNFDIEKPISQFPAKDIIQALRLMRPSTVAHVLKQIKDKTKRNIVISGLFPDQQEDVEDWIELRRSKERMGAEKLVLFKQKQRMEIFQGSLDKQRETLAEMLVNIRTELKDIHSIQNQIEEDVLMIELAERPNLAQIARIYDEMSAEDVVEILENEDGINERTFIKILSMMEQDSAAKVLGELEPEIAAAYTDALRTLRKESVESTQIGRGRSRGRSTAGRSRGRRR